MTSGQAGDVPHCFGQRDIRCPSRRLEPDARPRPVAIIDNRRDRIQEAELNHWLGEAQGLRSSLDKATQKLVGVDRARDRHPQGRVHLGIPIITDTNR